MTYETSLLTLHILGAAVMFGPMFAALLSVIRQPTSAAALGRLKFLGEVAKYASIWQLLTGVLLYLREPEEFNAKPIFFVKLGLYVVAGIVSATILKRQGMKAGMALQNGQTTVPTGNIRLIVGFLVIVLVAIIGIGVTLVSGGE